MLYISSFKSPKSALFDKNFICYYKTSHNVDSQLLYDVQHCVLTQLCVKCLLILSVEMIFIFDGFANAQINKIS